MRSLNYFWNKAVSSTKNGKFHPRPWKQFLLMLKVSVLYFLMTGRSIDLYE